MMRRKNPNQTRHHRLLGHDYASPGYYFITFGTHDGLELLGTYVDDQIKMADVGEAVPI